MGLLATAFWLIPHRAGFDSTMKRAILGAPRAQAARHTIEVPGAPYLLANGDVHWLLPAEAAARTDILSRLSVRVTIAPPEVSGWWAPVHSTQLVLADGLAQYDEYQRSRILEALLRRSPEILPSGAHHAIAGAKTSRTLVRSHYRPGIFLNIVSLVLAGVTIGLTCRLLRSLVIKRKRSLRNACLACGYPLEARHTCSECGLRPRTPEEGL